MRWFEENACLVDRSGSRDILAAGKEMQVLGARLAVPIIQARGRVYGAILIGEKASGLDYSTEEKELLSSVARTASISFDNAQLYQDLSRQQARLDAVLADITAGVVTVLPNKCVGMINQRCGTYSPVAGRGRAWQERAEARIRLRRCGASDPRGRDAPVAAGVP